MSPSRMLAYFVVMASLIMATSAANFYQDVECNYGGPRCQISQGGQVLTLSLDSVSSSGFQSKNQYFYGRFDVSMKLVPGNSAGTVTTFYLTSLGQNHNEIDMEFLGNASGQPYTLHTNIYCHGQGGREMQFRVPFDPTTAYHTYSIVWNAQNIIYLVDNMPIRVFNNNEANGICYLNDQAMSVYASLWDGDSWATQGGRIKTDWSLAPFVASYSNFNADACVSAGSPCNTKTTNSANSQTWQTESLDAEARNQLQQMQSKFLIYNYCTDSERFPQGFPPECKISS